MILPPEHAGACVLDAAGALCAADPPTLAAELAAGGIRFHPRRLRGAFPQIVPARPESGGGDVAPS